jgi:hypothetical protein
VEKKMMMKAGGNVAMARSKRERLSPISVKNKSAISLRVEGGGRRN